MSANRPDYRSHSLREACVREALEIIAEAGVEALSLREVARRLGVSHQAPYKHFQSRDHILAEVVARAFADFARHLDERPVCDDAGDDLAGMGRAYIAYALENPLRYRLMFGTPLPDPDQHPEMMRRARYAFSILRSALLRFGSASPDDGDTDSTDLQALFVWSTMHGLASILKTNAIETLGLSPAVLSAAPEHALARIGAALSAQNGDDRLRHAARTD